MSAGSVLQCAVRGSVHSLKVTVLLVLVSSVQVVVCYIIRAMCNTSLMTFAVENHTIYKAVTSWFIVNPASSRRRFAKCRFTLFYGY